MWDKIQYAFLYSWVKVHALLPMRALYVLSDILYVLIYKIAGYRVKVVRRNITASFPDKSKAEWRQLERRFYHHFADYIVETIKLAHISLDEIQQRAYLKNPELVDQLMEKGHTCFILTMGHYGNWEWFSGSTTRFEDSRIYQIYRPLNNKAFDKLFADLRTQFGSFGIKTLESKWIDSRQIEAARVALNRYMNRQGQVWIRIFPDKPITRKPADVRMGKGKGDPAGWVAPVTPGRILFEVEGVSFDIAKEGLRLCAQKLPVKTKFIVRRDYDKNA